MKKVAKTRAAWASLVLATLVASMAGPAFAASSPTGLYIVEFVEEVLPNYSGTIEGLAPT